MKTNLFAVGFLLLATLVAAPVRAGTEFLLYPLARAFGAPSEAELMKCRGAFRTLQSNVATCRMIVQPVLTLPGGAPGNRQAWQPELAVRLVESIRGAGGPGFGATIETPDAAPAATATVFGRNQLRYLWARAGVYGKYVQAEQPRGDYVLFTEIFGRNGRVDAIQVCLVAASGQVAYCRLFNSHHFGQDLSLDGACDLIARSLFEDLRKPPERVFPPYGVG